MKSKKSAWALFILVIVILVGTFKFHFAWWTYSYIFFFFMMAFCHLLSVNIIKMNQLASKKLDIAAFIFAIAGIIALIVEAILLYN